MKATTIIRVVLHTLTLLMTVAAIGFIIASVLMPYWRTARSNKLMETRMFGLWKICLKSDATQKLTCEWKEVETAEEQRDSNNLAYKQLQQKYMTSWEFRSLILLCVSIVFGVLALVFGGVGAFVDYCKYRPIFKCMCFAWIACTLIACILSIAGFILYLVHSYAKENRTITEQTDKLELIYGSSFYNCLTGIVLYGIALVLCFISTVLVCVMSHREKYNYVEVPRRSHGGHVVVSNV